MTTAVTTKVARSCLRSPNFQNLAEGELKMRRQKLFGAFGLLVGVFALLLLAPVASAQQFNYTITDLGPASVPGLAGATWMGTIYTGGTYTLGISGAGDVVGASPTAA